MGLMLDINFAINDMIIRGRLLAVGIAHLENSRPGKTTYANQCGSWRLCSHRRSHDHSIDLILTSTPKFNDMIIQGRLLAVGIALLETVSPASQYANQCGSRHLGSHSKSHDTP